MRPIDETFEISSHRNAPKATNTFPFLDLPAELRLLIYQYLIPNTLVRSHPPDHRCRRRPLRTDETKCAPALFAVNRLIHDEFFEAWFKNPDATYEISIQRDEIFFLGQCYSSGAALPETLKHVESLKMCFRGISDLTDFAHVTNPAILKALDERKDQNVKDLQLLESVIDRLLPGKCALKNLELKIVGPLMFWAAHGRGNGLKRAKECLEFNTAMFLRLRGTLESVSFVCDGPTEGMLKYIVPPARTSTWVDRLRPLLDEFEKKMMAKDSGSS